MLTQQPMFWIFVIIAALIGFVVAYYFFIKTQHLFPRSKNKVSLPSAFFQGMNFLLNEQSDEAVVALQQALKEKADSVEIQISLGNLFRRKGDIQRATQIHQKLLEQEGLDEYSYALTMHELGQDFYSSGLYDRAVPIFLEVIKGAHLRERSAKYLLYIYENEKDWRSAIKLINKYFHNSEEYNARLAHYYCQLSDNDIEKGNYSQASRYLDQADALKVNNVRVEIQRGRIFAAEGKHDKAIEQWQSVIVQNHSYLNNVIYFIVHSYRHLNATKKMEEFLRKMTNEYQSDAALLILADHLYETKGYESSKELLRGFINKVPSIDAIRTLLKFRINDIESLDVDEVAVTKKEMISFSHILDSVSSKENEYQCRHCGLATESHYWQCTSCRQWSSVHAISRIK